MKTKKKLTAVAIAAMMTFAQIALTVEPAFAEYSDTVDAFTYGDYQIPAYDGDAAEVIHDNDPVFDESELVETASEQYGDLDSIGRCTTCQAVLNQSLMPTYQRGSISSIKPTGWIQASYDIVSGGYLYNRCHLIGFQLTGVDNANEKKTYAKQDLITGTRYLNVGTGGGGMVLYENAAADYIKENADNYLAYRVTPVFEGDNLLASGVIMEGESIGDDELEFCVFCYNVQPGIEIDYATGESRLAGQFPLPIADCTASLSYSSMTYTGTERNPAVTVMNGETTLTKDKDYTVKYTNNKSVGKATVTITGIGNYTGTISKSFRILPKTTSIRILKASRKAFTAKWYRRSEQVSGYQIRYSLYSSMKSAKIRTITKNSTVSKKISNLKSAKKYYVQVRTYRTAGGTKYFSGWSKVRYVKTK